MIYTEFPFDPFFLFQSPLGQTLMGWLLNIPIKPNSTTHLITLPDKDKLAIEITTPKGWNKSDLTVILVHGLCGSHNSNYLIRITKKLERKNIRTIRVNLRGCGSGRGLAKSTYHCGRTDDILEALKAITEENPHSPNVLIGYSMGGNIVLKLAGELREEASRYLKKVIAVNPPIDMSSSVKLFQSRENTLYLRYFAKLLKEDIEYMKRHFESFPKVNLPRNMTLEDFNRMFVVPYFGFKDVEDYYRYASSKYVISEIKVPCKVLFSQDDPIVSWETIKDVKIPDNMDIYVTKKGGHLGYIGNAIDERGFYWLDSLLFDWILNG